MRDVCVGEDHLLGESKEIWFGWRTGWVGCVRERGAEAGKAGFEHHAKF